MSVSNPADLRSKTNYAVILYAYPGVGKTTIGWSAPDSLLIDADDGGDRVAPQYRRDAIRMESYAGLLTDLADDKLMSKYRSVIIDTGGQLIGYIKAWLIANNKSNAQKDGVTLSITGWGALGNEFMRLVGHISKIMRKNLVILFHAKDGGGEENRVVIDVEGGTKSNVWKPVQLGGFVELIGGRRVVTWGPTDRTDGKGTYGLDGQMEIPKLNGSGNDNVFLETVFAKMDEQAKAEALLLQRYQAVMIDIGKIVDAVTDAKTATEALDGLKAVEHVFGSKAESWAMLKSKAETLGLVYEKEQGIFTALGAKPTVIADTTAPKE